MHSTMLKIQGNRFLHYYKLQSTHTQKPKQIYEQTIWQISDPTYWLLNNYDLNR